MTPQELRERYCKSIGLDTNYRKFDDPYSQWLESYLTDLITQRDRAWEAIGNNYRDYCDVPSRCIFCLATIDVNGECQHALDCIVLEAQKEKP